MIRVYVITKKVKLGDQEITMYYNLDQEEWYSFSATFFTKPQALVIIKEKSLGEVDVNYVEIWG